MGGRRFGEQRGGCQNKGASGRDVSFGQNQNGSQLVTFTTNSAASLASSARCKSFPDADAGPLGTVPGPTGLLPSQVNGCFHELLLLDKTVFDQMFHGWKILTAEPEGGAQSLPTTAPRGAAPDTPPPPEARATPYPSPNHFF